MNTLVCSALSFFFFNDTATTEIYTLSLHDALPIFRAGAVEAGDAALRVRVVRLEHRRHELVERVVVELHARDVVGVRALDRKSTRLNSSHAISRMPSSA